jgi:hypothetical protein
MTWHERIDMEFSLNPGGFTEGEWAIKTMSVKLATRIGEMEKDGYFFSRTWEEANGKRWIRYKLVSRPPAFKYENNGQMVLA